MDEAERFARDRKLYRLHAITFLASTGGLAGIALLHGFVVPAVLPWLVAGLCAILAISGVLAIAVKRTILSKRAEEPIQIELDSDPGDALVTPGLWSGDLWPFFTNAIAPWGVCLTGVALLVASLLWALA